VSDLSELYQEVILDHYRNPRNAEPLADANRTAEGYNPLCGDRLRVFVRFVDDRIEGVSFEGTGCAISQASASVMTEALKGKTRSEMQELFLRFQALVTGKGDGVTSLDELGEMAAMSGVSEFPSRVKCATLGWHTLAAALEGDEETVTTEIEP
jgi:nitrogen fixation NifU-like protein